MPTTPNGSYESPTLTQAGRRRLDERFSGRIHLRTPSREFERNDGAADIAERAGFVAARAVIIGLRHQEIAVRCFG